MNDVNLLFVNCGRRIELIREFQKAYEELQACGKIVTCDIVKTAPASYIADKNYIVSKKTEKEFVDGLVEICNKENIHLIIPLIDPDLYILSRNKKYIESATKACVLVSSERVIDICGDKLKMYRFAMENGFDIPKILEDIGEIKFPLFIKPADGSASMNTFKVNNHEELNFFKKYVKNPIVQEFIKGNEYTVDAFLDFEGNLVSIVPRLRMKIRAGEVLVGKTVCHEGIIQTTKKILEALKPIGPITLQFMCHEEKNYLIEINPRFGGGCPLSINAGAKIPLWLLKLTSNEKINYTLGDFQEGLVMMRFDQSIYMKEDSP